jgi:hypothetical protein
LGFLTLYLLTTSAKSSANLIAFDIYHIIFLPGKGKKNRHKGLHRNLFEVDIISVSSPNGEFRDIILITVNQIKMTCVSETGTD